MKDEFDDATPDMFERGPNRKVSKISGDSRAEGKTYGEMAAQNKTEKAPTRSMRGGAGTGGGSGGAELKSIMNPKSMKKGGKVAGKLATRGYGKAR